MREETKAAPRNQDSCDCPYEALANAIRMLEFVMDGEHYAVDLSEIRDVIGELAMTVPCTLQSIVKPVVKRNRKKTIVFDLNRCLRYPDAGRTKRGKTGLLILNDKIAGSSMGLLVPGISSILTLKHSWKLNPPDPSTRYETPIHGILKKPGRSSTDRIPGTLIWIDVRGLIENCMIPSDTAEPHLLRANVA